MATDTMDIDMDIDLGPVDDFEVPGIDLDPEVPSQPAGPSANISEASEPTPHKVHLRGLDNLSTDDLKAFASEYDVGHFKRIEWIDDTSANFLYENAELALEALRKLAATDLPEESQLSYQSVPAKPLSAHPESNLQIRLAVVGDQKVAGARERSRFYLFNPQYDRSEQRRGDDRSRRRYRERDDGEYRARRYDDREQRRREAQDSSTFDASLYDDDEATVAARERQSHRRDSRGSSASGSDYRRNGNDDRRDRYRSRSTRELFPSHTRREGDRLRNRSASPMRDRDGDEDMRDGRDRHRDERARENRSSAQRLRQARSGEKNIELFPNKTKDSKTELFPTKIKSGGRLQAYDSVDEAASDLASRMRVPIMDGAQDQGLSIKGTGSGLLADRITTPGSEDSLSIRGAAGSQEVSIKGAASVKELFPDRFGGSNTGKELFSKKLQGRGGRRNKAEDLFS